MDKYVKLYRQLSPDEKTWANSKSFRKHAPKIFKGKELKEILSYANKNIEECEAKRKVAKKKLLDLVLKEEKPKFKSHCVACGRMIIPIDDPRKAREFEARGSYCEYCHSKGNKWAKKDFYGGDIRKILGFMKADYVKKTKVILTRDDLVKGRKMIKLK